MTRIASLFVLAASACSSTTAVEIDVGYEDDWGLTSLTLSAAERASTTEPSHRLTLLLPDDWAGTSLPISLVAMRGADSWAQGTADVVPQRGSTVEASMHLALLSCTTSCVEGSSKCVAGGLSTCTQRDDSCFDFGPPVACTDGKRCAGDACVEGDPVVLPSNSQTLGILEPTGITLDIETGLVFDTSADCHAGSALGNCEPVAPVGSPEVCVCRADTVTIHDLEVRGHRALAILGWTSVTVKGNLVVRPGAGVAAAYTSAGSAGGSYGTLGGNAGVLPVFGNAQLVPLAGGMTGQGTHPGRGGGALQITADQLVRVEGTISVPGGGAQMSDCPRPAPPAGDGGGSGGGLLLEARHVDIVGGVAANGGGGTGGGLLHTDNGVSTCARVPGGDGLASGTSAASGGPSERATCIDDIVAQSGAGGRGSIGDGIGGNTGTIVSGSDSRCIRTSTDINAYRGGGGGGAGRIRINTFLDACGCTGFLSPTPTYGAVAIE